MAGPEEADNERALSDTHNKRTGSCSGAESSEKRPKRQRRGHEAQSQAGRQPEDRAGALIADRARSGHWRQQARAGLHRAPRLAKPCGIPFS